jgi:predicted dinucleotide-binding enzyme
MVKVVEEEAMTTAIIGVGKIGNALARHLSPRRVRRTV